jgi:5-methylcytosine-specific restriction endonuclease McrA
MAAYYKKNADRIKADSATRRKEYPELNRAYVNKHRVLKLTLPYVKHETAMPVDGRCPHCRVMMTGKYPASNSPSLDHIIPLSRNGHHVPENTMMICLECNTLKGVRPLSYLLGKIALKDASCGITDNQLV